ncbi:MAG TPA: class I SAM-dependent methyltransferase [Vicinamibacterales bacterium]|nr:class I SAM-dependent methyltransferase [Vicinamibacterales bacterium]
MPNSSEAAVLEHVACAVCAADNYDVVYAAESGRDADVDHVRTFRASGDELLIDQLVRCRGCGFQYVNPRLASDVILSGYMDGDDPAYVSQLKARERTFAASLDEIERTAGGKGRLLDIGTAAGAFVAAARDRGWDAQGCEPNRWMAAWGAAHYGITIRQGTVFDQTYEDSSFDVITLWDVIEHTPDPKAVLERCRALLKPGGVLVVNYPDIGSWIARALGRRWLFLTSVHLYYFDRRTIRMILERTGYTVDAVRPHFQRLELDYILFRGSILSQALSRVSRALIRPFGLSRTQVPYWLGQTFVVARRASAFLVTTALL